VKVGYVIRLLPADELFWLTNAYVELAIIIVLAYGEGPVLNSRAFTQREVPG
jgi:hypothetical protein